MSELTIFHGALEIADPHARSAFLDQACAGDAALRQRIEDLLEAHFKTTPFMSQPAAEVVGVDREPVGEMAGALVAGRYTLLDRIGEGGMGEVWVAQQTEPVTRRVAIKLIKAGMDSTAVVARFEAERQALALMDHPNIARVFDGGLTDRGRPFFVMELVNGLPLTRFCDEMKLTPRERLELFVPVCQAVQHAHQKGIVHRDLKPTNVLVTLYDGRPVPKVIDFGVAKATGGKLTESTLATQFGAVIGTLEYMAPEQAGFSAVDVDTRADIYSLGVILYELLTGLKPFDTIRLHKAALDEVLRIIREEEPPRPSTRLSTDDALPSLAAIRRTEPKHLTALMRGELDWVVMRCLEKDRARRYETANALSRDVQRFLADEPVEARSPSAGYRLRKFVRRNRRPVLAASLVLLALIAGIVGTTLGLFEAKRQEELARNSAKDERTARLDAIAAAQAERIALAETQERLAQLRTANDRLGSIFDSLDPKEIARNERPLQVILVEKLEKAVRQLEDAPIGDKMIVAVIRAKFGKSLIGLGAPDKAIAVLQKAYDAYRERFGPTHGDTVSVMNTLGVAYDEAGKLNLALPLLEESLRLLRVEPGPDDRDTLKGMGNLGLLYLKQRKFELALSHLEEAFNRNKANFGAKDPDTVTAMNNLGLAYLEAGDPDRAVAILEEAQTILKGKPRHPEFLTVMNNLGLAHLKKRNFVRALPLLDEMLKQQKIRLGVDHPRTLQSLNNVAGAYQEAGKLDQAIPLFEEAVKFMKAKNPDHPDTISMMNNLAMAYLEANKLEPALPIFKDLVAISRKTLPKDSPQLGAQLAIVGWLLLQTKSFAESEVALREAILIREKKQKDHWSTFNVKSMLGGALLGQKRYSDAQPVLEEGYRGMKAREADLPPMGKVRLTEAADRLAELYVALGKPEEAAKLRPERPKNAEKGPPPRQLKP